MRTTKLKDPEQTLQERSNPFVWLLFHLLALWAAVSYWFRFKRVCSWHKPAPAWMGGNPLGWKVTHGICPACFKRVTGEIVSSNDYIGGARPVLIKSTPPDRENPFYPLTQQQSINPKDT